MSGQAQREGIAAALGAYVLWGLFPIYFKQLEGVPALEVIAHRILWCLLFMLLLLGARGRLAPVWQHARTPRTLGRAALAGGLVMTNWFVFVWAVGENRILETSLGYFITPLIIIVMGVVVLGERLRPRQWLAVSFAVAGVAIEGWRIGGLPWVSLALAGTFGSYGLLRKQLPVDAAGGLLLETACAVPFAAAYLAWLGGSGSFGNVLHTDLLLAAAGVLTAIPLLLFAIGARRLPLATVGFLQYVAPSLSFLVAIFLYDEPMNAARLTAFAAIWAGLALYSADLILSGKRRPESWSG